MKDVEDSVNVVYFRFDKNLDYKEVTNSFPIKKFLESAYGDFPTMVSPTKFFKFDRENLEWFVQNQYDQSKDYIVESRRIPSQINEDYYKILGESGEDLTVVEFEPETLLDDHLVTINKGDKVLGVFATENDFRHILDEIIIL